MITGLCPISESVVALGSDDSTLRLVKFLYSDELDLVPHPSLKQYGSSLSKPLLTLGKCSHHAVTSIDNQKIGADDASAFVVAAAGNSLSIWDILHSQRLSTYTTRGQYFACSFLNRNVVAAAGDDRALSLYDMRAKSGSGPLWNLNLASDNLYTIATANDPEGDDRNTSIYLAGANGAVYSVDIRKGLLQVWDLPQENGISSTSLQTRASDLQQKTHKPRQNAILDLSYSSGHLIAVRERGDVCGFSVELQSDDSSPTDCKAMSFSHRISNDLNLRVSCDTTSHEKDINIVVGGEAGHISTTTFHKHQKVISNVSHIDVTRSKSTPVPVVLWARNGGIYYGAGNQAGLIFFNSQIKQKRPQ